MSLTSEADAADVRRYLEADSEFSKEFANLILIGGGGFGTTFRATWLTHPERPEVALKCFLPQSGLAETRTAVQAWNPALRKSFHEIGASIAASYGCGYIAQFLAIRKFPIPMLITEWAGDETAAVLVGRPTDCDDSNLEFIDTVTTSTALRNALEIGIQIGKALTHAHRLGVQHLDVKPSNIVIRRVDADTSVRCKLIDFGVARVKGATRDARFCVAGGTRHYMSPEQSQGKRTTNKADVYALGFTVLQIALQEDPEVLDWMLRKHRASKAEVSQAVWEARALAEAVTDADVDDGLSGELAGLGLNTEVVRVLTRAVDPSCSRRPTAGEFTEALVAEYERLTDSKWTDAPFAELLTHPEARRLARDYLNAVREVEQLSLEDHGNPALAVDARTDKGRPTEAEVRMDELERLVGAYGRKLSLAQDVDRYGLSLRLAGSLLFLLFAASHLRALHLRRERVGSDRQELNSVLQAAMQNFENLVQGGERAEMPPIPRTVISALEERGRELEILKTLEDWACAVELALPAPPEASASAFSDALMWLRNGLATARWTHESFANIPCHRSGKPDRLTEVSAAFVAASILVAAVALARRQPRNGLFTATRTLLWILDLWTPSEIAREAVALGSSQVLQDDAMLLDSIRFSMHLQKLGMSEPY